MEAFFEMVSELAKQEWPELSEKEALQSAADLMVAVS